MRDFRDITISPAADLREALRVIDSGTAEIALVIQDEDRLAGTVTDGDIRRAILRGLPLETAVEKIMHREFTAVSPETSDEEALALLAAKVLKQLPVVDQEGRLLGIFLLKDLLGQAARPNPVVIMAGGTGSRLRPLTDTVPKPMLQVGGRPLLERTITRLVAGGFRDIYLSICYLGEQISDHFGDGSAYGCSIKYLREDEPLGTGGALSLLPSPPAVPVIVLNGDLLTEVNFASLVDYHMQGGFDATLCVAEFTYQVPYGVVHVDDHRALHIEEKPTQRFLINAGIYVVNPDAVGLIPPRVRYDLPQLLETLRARRAGSVGAFPIREYWMDIGRIADYEAVVDAYTSNGGQD